MSKILVVGASGFIGFPLYNLLRKKNEVTGTYTSNQKKGLAKLDITKKNEVRNFLRADDPEIVIHLAAETDVDLCEREKGHAYGVNTLGAKNIAKACEERRLIYFSTDFVFDGEKGNYGEADKASPINYYGKTKLDGETYAKKVKNHLVVRTSTPYSFAQRSKKFMNYAYEKLKNGERIRAFGDLVRSPTLIENLNENVALLLKKNESGILHLSGSEQLSMYEAAKEIAEVFGFDKDLIEETDSKNSKLDAKRPLNTGLDITLAKQMGLKMSGFREGLLWNKKIFEQGQ